MASKRKKRAKKPRSRVAIYHDMRVHENFNQCATRLVEMLHSSQQQFPGQPRLLFLDVQGHRNSTGGYDRDAFEIMNNFLLSFLGPYFTEISTPMYCVKGKGRQRDDVPERISITDPDDLLPEPRDANPIIRNSKPTVKAIADYLGLSEPCCMICWATPVERAHARPLSLVGSNDVRNFALLCKKHHQMAPDVEDSEAFWRWMDWALDIDGFFASMQSDRIPIGDDFFGDIKRQLREVYGWSQDEMQSFDWVEVMSLQYDVLDERTSKHFGVDRKASTHAWAFDQVLRQLQARRAED